MFGQPSINLAHFVVPGPRCSRLLPARGLLVPVFASLLLVGCGRREPADPVEDSETSGRISIAAAPDVRALVLAQVEAFQAGYPQARCTVRDPESSAQVISELLGGRADVAAAGRELEDEERRMASQNGIELEGHRIAQDGMCVVVRASNPVRNVTLGELQRILRGELTQWGALGGRDERIVPVLPPLSGDLARAFARRVMAGEPVRAAAIVEDSDSAVVERVRDTPGAFGVVPLALATGDRRVRALAIAALEGTTYVDPDMESVHDGSYPLSRYVNLFIRTRPSRLAGGFVTFVSSQPGQELVLASGRVPTAVPLRFVRRSPLLGSH